MHLYRTIRPYWLVIAVGCGPDVKSPSIELQFAAASDSVPIPPNFATDAFVQSQTAPQNITALRCHGLIVEEGSSTVQWSIALTNDSAGELIILLDNVAAEVYSNRVSLDVLYQPQSPNDNGVIEGIFPEDVLTCTISAEDGTNPMSTESQSLSVLAD